ncbi:MAG: hypothetical protein H0T60_00420 [Acidobacteria bacterium]|nr:hypothetical protein [Acidobacteriota bacterium]
MRINLQHQPRGILHAVVATALALMLCACAAVTRPPDPSRPRGASDQPYPVVLNANPEREASALAAWSNLLGAGAAGALPTPALRPVTATLIALPPNLSTLPRMPRVIVKDAPQQSEEETRESLRRFIERAAPLLGVAPGELSLVEVTDAPGGAKRARYRQTPFRFPLRNGYGDVEVIFTPDLRVSGLSSTAIPDAERLRLALAAFRGQLIPAEKAVASLADRIVAFTDAAGIEQSHTVSATGDATARELVVFPVQRDGDAVAASTLELHIAWEIYLGAQSPPLLVYVDALTGEQLSAGVAGGD